MKKFISFGEEETKKIGESILSQAKEKGISVILISGELGAGKTVLVKGMGRELGIREDEITSPTFTISQEYISERGKILHVDLYRLDKDEEIKELLSFISEKIKDGYIAVFEWGEKIDEFIPWRKIFVEIKVKEKKEKETEKIEEKSELEKLEEDKIREIYVVEK